MDAVIVKQNIKNTQEQFNNIKASLLAYIKKYVEFLNLTSHGLPNINVAANGQPYKLTLSQLNVMKVNLDTSNGVKVILDDNQTQIPINKLPLEDLLQLYKKLYYQ